MRIVEPSSPEHPLTPLTADEITLATNIFRASDVFPKGSRFVSIELQEPSKAELADYAAGNGVPRRAFMVIRDVEQAKTYEATVSLSDGRVISLAHIPGVQPGLLFDDFLAVEDLVRSDHRWQEAMHKRGVTDFEHVMIEPWPCAYLDETDSPNRRLNRPLTYVRYSQDENAYAHPVDNLTVLVDLDRHEVLEVVDHGVVPLPPRPGDYWTETSLADPDNVPTFPRLRDDLKPLLLTQPEGPSFTVDGNEVR